MPIPSAVVPLAAAGISAGGNLLSGALGSILGFKSNKDNLEAQRLANETNMQIQRETNAANMQINQNNIDAQMALQNDAQNWNSEVSQANRMRLAGLNPNNSQVSSSTMAASSVPSSIPNYGSEVSPVMSNSDTYVNPLLQGVANSSQAFAQMSSAMSEQLGTQYQIATFDTRVDELREGLRLLRKQILNMDQDTREKTALTGYYNHMSRMVDVNTRLLNDTFDDHKQQVSLQNELMRNQAAAALEQSRLYASNVITDGLNRVLGQNADKRANQLAIAEIQQMLDNAYYMASLGKINDQTLNEMRMTAMSRFNQIKLNNGLTKAQILSVEAQMGIFTQQIENLRKQNQSYWIDKGFSWFGQLSSGVRDIGIGLRGFGSINNNVSTGGSPRGYHISEPPSSSRTGMSMQEWMDYKRSLNPNWRPNFLHL